jgi:YidC/Oxa1 family membrane protein insertase
LTAPAAVKGLPPAFAISVDDAPLTRTLDTALFRPSVTELRLSGDPERDRVVFEYQDSSGLTARKEFAFGSNGRGYVVTVTASVRRGGDELAPRIHSGPGLGDVTDVPQSSSFLVPSYRQPTEGILFRDGEVERHPPSALATESRFEGTFGYIGIDDHYFIQVLLPGDRPLAVQYVTADAGGGTSYVGYVSEFDRGPASATYFFGPKKFEVLSGIDTELVRAINFGMFDVIVVPLLRALNWVNGYVGNYGWSIIILTILINAAMFPLRHKSVVSMRKMQQLQPQAQAIQKRYANLKVTDPARQKMNSELMELYRQHKVNPASGCVPMLLTLPVLFAFYSMLSQAIELRGAPFVGWITDLSTYDPSFITPLLMGATMVWQQKIQPSTADPVQQKVMMFMPIMFTFMFLWAPSGLVLYWLISNVWAIGQQYLTNAITGAPAGVPAKPARAGQ